MTILRLREANLSRVTQLTSRSEISKIPLNVKFVLLTTRKKIYKIKLIIHHTLKINTKKCIN